MPETFFKFKYNQKIKKCKLAHDQMNWESLCNILKQIFHFKDKDNIRLTYIDNENDEISVINNDELCEAIIAQAINNKHNLIKFNVCCYTDNTEMNPLEDDRDSAEGRANEGRVVKGGANEGGGAKDGSDTKEGNSEGRGNKGKEGSEKGEIGAKGDIGEGGSAEGVKDDSPRVKKHELLERNKSIYGSCLSKQGGEKGDVAKNKSNGDNEDKKEKEDVVVVNIDSNDMKTIFSKLFESLEFKQKLIEHLLELKAQKHNTALKKPIKYNISPDYTELSQFLTSTFNNLINSSFLSSSTSSSMQVLPAKEEEEEEKQDNNHLLKYNNNTNAGIANTTQALLNNPLTESCYERIPMTKAEAEAEEQKQKPITTLDENARNSMRKSEFVISNIPLSESILTKENEIKQVENNNNNNNLNYSSLYSSSLSRLSKSTGVRLVLQYENGKAKFIPVPIEDYNELNQSRQSKIFQSFSSSMMLSPTHREGIINSVFESIPNVERNLANGNASVNFSKKQGEQISIALPTKNDEFTKGILKHNRHDIDKDLSAPYDKTQITKVDNRHNLSQYERIE